MVGFSALDIGEEDSVSDILAEVRLMQGLGHRLSHARDRPQCGLGAARAEKTEGGKAHALLSSSCSRVLGLIPVRPRGSGYLLLRKCCGGVRDLPHIAHTGASCAG